MWIRSTRGFKSSSINVFQDPKPKALDTKKTTRLAQWTSPRFLHRSMVGFSGPKMPIKEPRPHKWFSKTKIKISSKGSWTSQARHLRNWESLPTRYPRYLIIWFSTIMTNLKTKIHICGKKALALFKLIWEALSIPLLTKRWKSQEMIWKGLLLRWWSYHRRLSLHKSRRSQGLTRLSKWYQNCYRMAQRRRASLRDTKKEWWSNPQPRNEMSVWKTRQQESRRERLRDDASSRKWGTQRPRRRSLSFFRIRHSLRWSVHMSKT